MKLITVLFLALMQLIPAPVSLEEGEGIPAFPEKERILLGRRASKEFHDMTASLPAFARQEAYRISIGRRKAVIEALTDEGAFRARQTLRKLRLLSPCPRETIIFDYPRFAHRGLMIDESRSFKGKEFILKQLEAMALLGLNTLHLHLTDAAGWRLEILSHPELTEKAAWRRGVTYAEWEAAGYPFCSRETPGAYGGFYTRDDIREIVLKASELHIDIIPEIEMPGHSMEVNRTYPEIACVDEDGRHRNFSWDLCPGNEGTFSLLRDVLDEVMEMFPGKYIHIGGDEAVMKDWPQCVNCRRRMEEEGFTEVRQLQGYMIRRISEYLISHGRIPTGWDEILETGIPPEAVVMSWRGSSGGEKAAALGHKVIMSPNTHCYFDYYQDLIRKEPLAVGDLTSLHWVYCYDPGDSPNILGLQANLWCEKIPTPEHAEYMLYPRLFAISEIGWSPAGRDRDPVAFRTRARALLDVFRKLGYNTFDMDSESDFAKDGLRRTMQGQIIYPPF